MPTASPATTLRLLALLAAAVAVVAAADDGMTRLHLYIHETVAAGPGASTALLGGNSSFGSVGPIDDELREGPDPASQYLGRAEGMLAQADLGSPAASCAILNLAFTEGDYGGSTLVVDGRVDLGADGKAVVELAVVGGTGRFRRARGYSLMTKIGNPSPSTVVVFEMDLYVKISG
ncbi:dirigent protein 21-like [Panicum miliaceum]|uniref:Dirigent protein n=1 Tax=Panicum miliaceum TaxID=4540 RepID=A0A3L6SEZ4_PANMI|nr:dirigent protein 21-like [Panicum miliaceum]